ncbi:MAG: hypothetical protein U9Q37_06585 [Euryarchaeota archaeon]|nr:hypothetical protein [Euryarchaeota archaeon]
MAQVSHITDWNETLERIVPGIPLLSGMVLPEQELYYGTAIENAKKP